MPGTRRSTRPLGGFLLVGGGRMVTATEPPPVVKHIDHTLRLMELVADARDPFAAFRDLLLDMRCEITKAEQ